MENILSGELRMVRSFKDTDIEKSVLFIMSSHTFYYFELSPSSFFNLSFYKWFVKNAQSKVGNGSNRIWPKKNSCSGTSRAYP